MAREFDVKCAMFTHTLAIATNWKHEYPGATYSTRILSAIRDVRSACDRMERVIKADRAALSSHEVSTNKGGEC